MLVLEYQKFILKVLNAFGHSIKHDVATTKILFESTVQTNTPNIIPRLKKMLTLSNATRAFAFSLTFNP